MSSTVNRAEVVYDHSIRGNHRMRLEAMVMFVIAVLGTLDLVLSHTDRSSRWVWAWSTGLSHCVIHEQTHMSERVRGCIANII